MGEPVRSHLRCSYCDVRAATVHDRDLGELKVELEHLADDVHNIVPVRNGVRGHSAILLDPDLEQRLEAWQIT